MNLPRPMLGLLTILVLLFGDIITRQPPVERTPLTSTLSASDTTPLCALNDYYQILAKYPVKITALVIKAHGSHLVLQGEQQQALQALAAMEAHCSLPYQSISLSAQPVGIAIEIVFNPHALRLL